MLKPPKGRLIKKIKSVYQLMINDKANINAFKRRCLGDNGTLFVIHPITLGVLFQL